MTGTPVTGTPVSGPAAGSGGPSADVHDLSTAQLVSRMTEQTSTLVRSEVQLATAEIQRTVREVGKGAGLFGGAGVVGLYAGGALVATAILALAEVLDAWLAALVVTLVLLAVAGVMALLGKKKVEQAPPPADATKRNVQRDIAAVKEARS